MMTHTLGISDNEHDDGMVKEKCGSPSRFCDEQCRRSHLDSHEDLDESERGMTYGSNSVIDTQDVPLDVEN
jgi:hypothetical protein